MTLARSFRLGILSLGALLFLAPYIFMLSTAAKSQQDIFSSSLSLIPHNWALLDNLAKAFSRVPMGLLLFNGIVVCALILVIQVVVAIPCAYAMAKLNFRGQRTMMMMVMLGLLVPIHATALPFYV
ncbi:MAG TPA: carbohydrate ABC transporter permease, partial [Ochrobactrum anthropi]|nr:carbohydrate ABC transporter permease [Brucella anthropi]